MASSLSVGISVGTSWKVITGIVGALGSAFYYLWVHPQGKLGGQITDFNTTSSLAPDIGTIFLTLTDVETLVKALQIDGVASFPQLPDVRFVGGSSFRSTWPRDAFQRSFDTPPSNIHVGEHQGSDVLKNILVDVLFDKSFLMMVCFFIGLVFAYRATRKERGEAIL